MTLLRSTIWYGTAILSWFVLLAPVQITAQQIGGTAKPGSAPQEFGLMSSSGFVTSSVQAEASSFFSTLFTFNDIILFSYHDNTEFTIRNASGNTIWSGTLNTGEYRTEMPGRGTYTVTATESFSVLAGDPASNIVQGYFAVDQNGRAASERLYTYMMDEFEDGKFIVFAYENQTYFEVRNLDNGNLLASGTLNRGDHYTLADTPYDTYLEVSANKPVTALSFSDQDYYVPASNGTFSGTTFYGYSGYTGNWANSITVSSYHDNNEVVIRNSETGQILASQTLGRGQVMSHPVTSPVYWEVEAQQTVTAASIPYAGWTGNYYYKARVPDETGLGLGTLFYLPAIASMVDVTSYEDGNDVTVTLLGSYNNYPYLESSQEVVFEGTLQASDTYRFFSNTGNQVYKVESSGPVSVVQRNGDSGADFMPLNYPQDTSEPDPGPEPEPNPDPEADPDTEPEPDPDPGTGTDSDSDTDSEPNPGPDSEPDTDDSDPDPNPGPGQNERLPERITIGQNYPNPFNPSTNIRFSLPESVHVEIRLYDLSGRRITTLVNETRTAGHHTISVDMSTLSSGVYIYQMVAGSFIENRKLTLIK